MIKAPDELVTDKKVDEVEKSKEPQGPSVQQVREFRRTLGMTQAQAAEFISRSVRTWESYESGERTMPADTWELAQIKARLYKR